MTRKTDRLWLKTLAFLLCVVSIVVMVGGAAASFIMAGWGGSSEETLWKNCFQNSIYRDLQNTLRIYVQERSGTASLEAYNRNWFGQSIFSTDNGLSPYTKVYLGESNLRYEILDENGKRVAGTYQGEEALVSLSWRFENNSVLNSRKGSLQDYETDGRAAEFIAAGEILHREDTEVDSATACITEVGEILYWEETDETYTVRGYLLAGFPYEQDTYGVQGKLIHLIYANRVLAVIGVVVGLAGMILCLIYLLNAAGRRYEEPGIHLNFLDKLPFDLYTLALGGLFTLALWLLVELVEAIFGWYHFGNTIPGIAYILLGCGGLTAVCAASVLAFLMTMATRIKYGKGYWWRRSVVGWCLCKLWRVCKWMGHGFLSLMRMLPAIWLRLLFAGVLWLLMTVCAYSYDGEGWYFLFSLVFGAAVVYSALSLEKLRCNGKKLAEGQLGGVDSGHLHGVYREISEDMQDLGKGAERAVEEKMKSERLKTELITNVSHDIKTPLTSIVNYVDLLQKPHTPEEEAEYLKVLDRQSKRMKKLTEDLVEMSKASTGNIPAYLEPTNLTELANQALAEYEEKFSKANLLPELTVIGKNGERLPEDSRVMVSADGRLLWRVLDNLFGNVFKYAMPGTRVYVDIVQYEKTTMLSVKNISRERLNVSAEELMERFVRGDTSRNTEGSGLGLNIAKSLMDLQKADLNLVVDGDLFKAVLLYDAMPTQEEPVE